MGMYVIDGARTPFGSYGKSLTDINPTQLGEITAIEAIKRAQLTPGEITDVVYGNVIHSSKNAAYVARHTALKAGVSSDVPAMLVNRLCGSGMQAVVSAIQNLRDHEDGIALCGGIENMSQSPHASFTHRFHNQKFGAISFEDMLLQTLSDEYIGSGMGITAENLANQYNISREEQDEYASLSHRKAAEARAHGRLNEEIVPVPLVRGELFSEDEGIKPDTSVSLLGQLRPSFLKDGTVTAGNSSSINDGAVSLIIAHEKQVKKKKLTPIAEIVSWSVTGVDPSIMGIGPVPAIQKLLQRENLSLDEVGLFEVNEAFSSQFLAVEKELKLERSRTNVNGGAIALGHPVGASGARLLLTLAYEMKHRNEKYGVASLCIGGGQGIAMLLKLVK
ncbi:thiolase family protein [Fictibacillus barbaricus]|uniref:acetyl-CoA C-acetyltransferase n=1 Tax=Fictibacillus barbaricus TaxID=182136 RepID=A0ABS2ZHW7_9BACL|nr:thiolase family protein [Fictibacillus barbaricus]MBN3547763.1 thiolase family protein [Fictibacillus barbaricus]GGB51365.1 acetyl-CoA acetyltransferase [Fictibacillus barbaricus]